jgi:hydrogenase maturation protease
MAARSGWRLILNNLLQAKRAQRLAVLGIGHELRGDDAAGLNLVRALKQLSGDDLLILEGGSAPENCTGQLRRFQPAVVLMVDAAHFAGQPGSIELFSIARREKTGEPGGLAAPALLGNGGSTHSSGLHMLAHYLNTELDCDVYLLGIQPAQNEFGAPLSPSVKAAVADIGAVFSAWRQS